jgi:hypothetical protein
MPKFHFKKSVKSIDANRSRRIKMRLTRLSQSRRREQLKQAQLPAQKRGATRLTLTGKIPLNKMGNRRGMHNVLNPPTSEQMKLIRAKRKIYNRQMPVLQCSGCAFATSCPQFKAGFECAYLPYLNSHKIESEEDLIDSMKNLCEAQMSRVHRQAMMETLTGAMPSLETAEAMNLAFMQLKTLHDKITEGEVDATLETEDESIIGRLFGGLDELVDHTAAANDNPLDVAPALSHSPEAPKMLPAPSQTVNLELIREHTKDSLAQSAGKRRNEFTGKPNTNTVKVVVSNIKV